MSVLVAQKEKTCHPFTRIRSLAGTWLWTEILVPFGATRAAWLLIAWFGNYFVQDPAFQKYSAQGYFLTPHFWLDIWTRWDAKWYISIVTEGYKMVPDLTKYLSNVAFFPLYPGLVRLIGVIFPQANSSTSIYFGFGLLISNVSFLIAAALLYKLVMGLFYDRKVAHLTLLLVFVFPTSFIFSCFYTESLYLLLSVASFYLAFKHKWAAAGVTAALLALTRPQGILIVIPMAWLYLSAHHWKVRELGWRWLWLALPPAALAAFFLYLHPLTGSFTAPLLAQKAWYSGGNLVQYILSNFQNPAAKTRQIEIVIWFVFAAITLLSIRKQPTFALGFYALAQLAVPVYTVTLMSFARFAVVIFPVFIFAAKKLKGTSWQTPVIAILFTLQALFFLGWVNYYWIA